MHLPDVVDWTLATGCRIGAALALRFGTDREGGPLLDLDARTWEVNATVARETGVGPFVQPQPKTAAGWRVIALADFAIDLVLGRLPLHERDDTGLVLAASILGTPRDLSNVAGACASCSTPSRARRAVTPATESSRTVRPYSAPRANRCAATWGPGRG